ncbi:hypothetical protein LSM04_005721 [Trypanosoma melophagium]|uniref:uncharacterized protein n=1 Tax=Trypanosoma melophagium TaxID=715481 RepID=UPI00351A7670|nr:hypothetical protein LSM04_005721 [Trypanosoma melophagium]
MSLLSILTPAERRFFDEALQRALAKRALEKAKESAPQEPNEQQQHYYCDQEQLQPQEQQHSVPRYDRFCDNSTKPSDILARYSELSRQEYDLWDRVERSLEFPFVYRSEASKNLCYKMLRRVPLLRTLNEGDLEVISSHIEVFRIGGTEMLAGKPPFPDVNSRFSLQLLTTKSQSQFDDNDVASGVTADPPIVPGAKVHHEPRDSINSSNSKIAMGNRIFILLRGRVVLRIPSLQSAIDAFVEPYEVFALPLIMEALPDGSWYETDGDCMLISLTCNVDLSLDRVIGRLEKNVIESRVSFLQRQLRVKVFTHWTPEQYEACARALVPLRVSWRQVVVEQGMESDAMYFIYEGQCVVVRDVPLHRQQKEQAKPHTKHMYHQQYMSTSSPKTPASSSRRRSPQKQSDTNNGKMTSHLAKLQSTGATSPLVKTMEVVTLREGEFFGELGLLNHQVDWKPDVDTIWSKDYWQKTLDRALRAPVDFSSLEGDLSWRSKKQGKNNSNNHNDGDSENTNNNGVFPPVPLPRQATVYTKSPCVFFMLSNDHCRRLFGDREYAQLKEFAKGYPSCEDIEEQYERQRRWSNYRKTLVNAVMKDSSSAKRKIPKLPPLQFH